MEAGVQQASSKGARRSSFRAAVTDAAALLTLADAAHSLGLALAYSTRDDSIDPRDNLEAACDGRAGTKRASDILGEVSLKKLQFARGAKKRQLLLLARVADVGKLRLERGAADKEAVDIGLAGKLDRVGGRDGAAAKRTKVVSLNGCKSGRLGGVFGQRRTR